MYNYNQLLPDFEDLIKNKVSNDKRAKKEFRERKTIDLQDDKVSSLSSSKTSSASSTNSIVSLSSSSITTVTTNVTTTNQSRPDLASATSSSAHSNGSQFESRLGLFELPPIINNSLIVRQKASAKDSLAAATVATAASLPLMIGGRSKCVVNIVQKENLDENNPENKPISTNNQQAICKNFIGPKNTALRAEQRKQNMISIVRPVVNLQQNNSTNKTNYPDSASSNSTSHSIHRKKFEQSSFWKDTNYNQLNRGVSIIDELMNLEQSIKQASSRPSSFNINKSSNLLDNQQSYNILFSDPNLNTKLSNMQISGNRFEDEAKSRQQMLLYRREEYELNRNIRKQHRFVSIKIEERKRNLLIIQSVWFHRDFKHAIEKLVDIYHQGLMFNSGNNFICDNNRSTSGAIDNGIFESNSIKNCKLSSLNSSLVADVLSIIILRPQLWNLEICQLLLPIIVNDLLSSDSTQQSQIQTDIYTEVSLKALKLILTSFSPVIKSTLESFKDSTGFEKIGIDLTHEERIGKCLNCYKLLIEAKSIIGRRCGRSSIKEKHSSMYRELHQSFISLENSIEKVLKEQQK